MSKAMKCPDCGNTDQLSTIENLEGLAECDFIDESGPEWSGTTDVLFDESDTVGVCCGCGWEYKGPDWINQLVSV